MREKQSTPLGLYMLGISALFLAGFLMLVILGARSYRNTAAGQEENNQTRGLLAYLSAMARANDAEGAVYISGRKGPEDSAVLVMEDGSGYAARIYCWKGYLVEDYGEADGDFLPEEAMKIGKTELFTLTAGPYGGLTAVTDEGTVYLALRSGGGTGGGEPEAGAGSGPEETAGVPETEEAGRSDPEEGGAGA